MVQIHKNLVLFDFDTFQKWLKFIRYAPGDRDLIFAHIKKIMQFQNFKRALLPECLKMYLKDRVISIDNPESVSCFTKQDSLESKQKHFDIVSCQLNYPDSVPVFFELYKVFPT